MKQNDSGGQQKWWRFLRTRPELRAAISGLDRVLVTNCGATPHLSFAFLPSQAVFSHTLAVFPFDGFHEFCVLQCRIHEVWTRLFASTMKDDLRYTPSDCFETFPVPDNPVIDAILEKLGREYYEFRADLMVRRNEGLTRIYNRFHDPDERLPDIIQLRELHAKLDHAVLNCYGWRDLAGRVTCDFYLDYEEDEEDALAGRKAKKKPYRYRWPDEFRDEVLARLLELNQERAREEQMAGLVDAVAIARPGNPVRKSKESPQYQVAIDWEQDRQVDVASPPDVQDRDIEPAILVWLLARERDYSLIEAHRPKPIIRKVYRQQMTELHSIRLAKEEYSVIGMVGVPAPVRFTKMPKGPLSTTYYVALRRAEELGWIKVQSAIGENTSTDFELGPNAADAIKKAFTIIADRDQEIEDVLFYLEAGRLIEAEQQATVHKAWSDLRLEGKAGTSEEVVKAVQEWKPNRPGFSRGEILTYLKDLKDRKLIR